MEKINLPFNKKHVRLTNSSKYSSVQCYKINCALILALYF